jgi:glycosyltransferase involved in cell wall biosynthesis
VYLSTLLSINNYNYRRGGAEVVFLEQNSLLRSVGWNVVPFAMRHAKNLYTPWERFFVSEIEFGERYSPWQKAVLACKAIYSWEARRNLQQLLNAVRPDLAHCHNIYHHLSPSVLPVLKSFGLPIIVTLHDLKLVCPAYTMLAQGSRCERCKGGKLYELLHNKCMKGSVVLSGVVFFEALVQRFLKSYRQNVDRFVVPSQFYVEKFVEWGWERDAFVHIPNFVDVQTHFPDFSPGRHFLYFGRLSPEKGIATLVEAAALAEVPISIVGTGPQEGELRRLAHERRAMVTFHGYLAGEKLHQAVRSARATVLPSEWYENGPLSVLESYALGKPVIGAAIGGIPELIRDGETGFSFVSGSVDSLADVLRQMADLQREEVMAMGRTARDWVENEFTAQRYLERILDLYQSMTASFHR